MVILCADVSKLIWKFFEVHSFWFTLLAFLLNALSQFCALNFVVVCLISIALCIPVVAPAFTVLILVYLISIYFFKIYQWYMPFLSSPFAFNFTLLFDSQEPEYFLCPKLQLGNISPDFVRTSEWLGIQPPLLDELSKNFLHLSIIIILVGIQFSAWYRCRKINQESKSSKPFDEVFFPGVVFDNFDTNLLNCLKFFVNYGFYKFGFEISVATMVLVAWVRMDIVGGLLIIWVFFFMTLSRFSIKTVWPFFVAYLGIMFPLQYAMAIGIPVEWCIEYPWNHLLSKDRLDENLSLFLNLANNRLPANRFYDFIIADFFLLLVVTFQRLMFNSETEDHPAGSNSSIYKNNVYVLHKSNPRDDFMVQQKNLVDFLKLVVFAYGHWMTIICVLAAGLGGTSLFALGYLILSFWMLWLGNSLYTMNRYAQTVRKWKWLTYYTVSVMFFKVTLQVLACSLGYIFKTGSSNSIITWCSIEKFFSIVCVNSVSLENMKYIDNTFSKNNKVCDLKDMNLETKIGFDTVAFIFILFQLRILNSWYFQHCMIEFRCEMIQAKRGAILINQLIEKEMREQNEHQNQKFREIKQRMSAIRQRYEKQQKQRGRVDAFSFAPQSYEQAKRAGDYYMFDYNPDTDELAEFKSFIPEVTPGATKFNKLNWTQLLHTAIQKDLDLSSTLTAVESAERINNDELRMIAAVAKTKKERDLLFQILEERKKQRHQKNSLDTDFQSFSNTMTAPTLQVASSSKLDITKKESTLSTKIQSLGAFTAKIFAAMFEWTTAFLNRQSREHRYVSYVLNKEKKKLKQYMNDDLYNETKTPASLRRQWEAYNVHLVTSERDICRLEDEAHTRWEERSVFARLATAVGNSFSAHTDILCFFVAIWAHARSAGLITLPLVGLVFFWGSLASPRPSKFFWIGMISYTEFTIVVKFIFQFSFWPWNNLNNKNKYTENPYDFPYVLGIQKVKLFALADVLLLILLFFHRSMLRRLGLWKDANVQDTFLDNKSRPIMPRACAGSSKIFSLSKTKPFTLPAKPHKELVTIINETRSLKKIEECSKSNFEIKPNSFNEAIPIRDFSDSDPFLETARENSIAERIVTPLLNFPEERRCGIFAAFITKLLKPKFRYIRDLYPTMFFLDMICFLIIALDYSAFGEGGSGNVLNDLQTNRVPLAFVLILIVMMLMMVVDRGLYLRKVVFCKLIYQILSIIFFNVWIFGVLPFITKIPAFYNPVAKLFYIIKGIYFLVSAWQIRNGYPQLCVGNLLTRSYGMLNMIMFKIFLLVPFLFELRTAIDWTWTDTSMPLFDYFNMENFYAVIYNLKCARTNEQNFPAPRGERKGDVVKYFMGFPMILLLILIIWCPLLAFSMLNRIGVKSTPDLVKLSVSVEGFPPLFSTEAQGEDLQLLTENNVNSLTNRFLKTEFYEHAGGDASRQAVAFVKEYKTGGILRVKLRPESETRWQISNVSLKALRFQLMENTSINGLERKKMNMKIHLEFRRPRLDKSYEPSFHSMDFPVPISGSLRADLYAALQNTAKNRLVTIPFILPMNIIVPNEGGIKPANVLLRAAFSAEKYTPSIKYRTAYNNLSLELSEDYKGFHWQTKLIINKNIAKHGFCFKLQNVDYESNSNLKYIEFVAFVDRVFPSFINKFKFVKEGIFAMYIAVVLLVGKLIRNMITNSPTDVIITEIPNPNYLLKICLDIYLVREARDFVLEQDLYAKLIFLFRSPSTLINWTRQKIKSD